MAKPPLMGRVKTRLAADIGPVGATSFYRFAVARLLHRLHCPAEWRQVLAVNADPETRFACWPRGTARMGQGRGNLGDRMRHVLRAVPGPTVIIGTDSPQIEPRHIREAFAALGANDAVFGPSDDGGYWLIGLAGRRPTPRLFEKVRWSTEDALADTVRSLPEEARVAHLRQMVDVDDAESLDALKTQYRAFRFGPWQPRRGSAAART